MLSQMDSGKENLEHFLAGCTQTQAGSRWADGRMGAPLEHKGVKADGVAEGRSGLGTHQSQRWT